MRYETSLERTTLGPGFEKMIDRKDVLQQFDSVSTKVSDLARFISFGILALAYSIFSSESTFNAELLESSRHIIMGMAAAAACAILFDYLQYLFGFFNSQAALNKKTQPISYSKGLFWYGRYFFFYAKQVLVLISASLLLYSLSTSLFPFLNFVPVPKS